jgi:hypothetical protein
VLRAVDRSEEIERERLHNEERSTAFIAFQIAEYTRDRKARRKPYSLDDFFFFKDPGDTNLPEPRFGAAAVKLAEMGEFPFWALFAFPELKRRAANSNPPELLCLRCEDAIILAPNIDGEKLSGMLIAQYSASDTIREMQTPEGRTVLVRLPKLNDKVVAMEDPELRALV